MFSRFFIERPIFASGDLHRPVLAGAWPCAPCPSSSTPRSPPVQVTVSATYPGADSKTLADSVAAPIEAQINGVDTCSTCRPTSSSTGMLTLTVYFSLDTDPDIAQVASAETGSTSPSRSSRRPWSSRRVGPEEILVDHDADRRLLEGQALQPEYIANYANVYVLDASSGIPGAGQASIMGIPTRPCGIWMNPDRMASLEITTTDIQRAVVEPERPVRRGADRPAAHGGGASS